MIQTVQSKASHKQTTLSKCAVAKGTEVNALLDCGLDTDYHSPVLKSFIVASGVTGHPVEEVLGSLNALAH